MRVRAPAVRLRTSKRVPPSSRQTVPTLFRWFPSATDAVFSTAGERASPAADVSFGHLLQIFPGPVHDPEDFFTERLEQLSSSFTGVVLTRGTVARTLRIGRFEVRVLPEGAGIRGGELLAFMRAAIRVVRETRVDAVVTYDPLKSGLVGYCASRLARAPLIVEVNGDYTAEANYVDISNPVLRRLKRGVFVRLEGFVLRRAAGIKLLYPTQIDSFKPALRNQVVRTFPDFVGWRTFRDLGESPEILFVGFPYRLKGVDVLIAAFKQVAEDFPEWRLKILGWFPDRSALDAATGGHPRIQYHPPVYHREMPAHVGRCGVFVLPSRTEAMGRVLVEAMACGKPCIGTSVGGIPGVIVHGESGLLVRAADAGDLARALALLMRDGGLRRRLGENGRRRVERDFSVRSYVAHIKDFYRTVLDRARRARSAARFSLAWISSWAAAAPEAYQPGLML